MKVREFERRNCPDDKQYWLPENIVEIDKNKLRYIADKICQPGGCRYPLLALRILIYVITGIDSNGIVHISARQLAKSFGVHYDTVTKCLKYLRQIGVLSFDK